MKQLTTPIYNAATILLPHQLCKLVLCMVLTLSSIAAWAEPSNFVGNGSKENPYLIQSIEDWNILATDVNNGDHYSNTYFRLTADITVDISNGDKMIGDVDAHRVFCGNFDGVGHTLTFKYVNGYDSYVAPFRYIVGAQISRLNITGTLHTSGKFAGGIVGQAYGAGNLIESCHVSTTMILDRDNDASSGGLLGLISESGAVLEMKNCLFDGVLCCTMNVYSYACGGLVGWAENTITCKAYNCYYNPSGMLPAGRKAIGEYTSATLIRYRGMNDNLSDHVDNCLYSHTLGQAQGNKKGSKTPQEIVSTLNNFGGHPFNLWELNENSEPVPAMRLSSLTFAQIEGLKHLHYIPSGQSSVTIQYTIYDDTWHQLSLETDCDVYLYNYQNNTQSQISTNEITISSPGHYRLSVRGRGVYLDNCEKEFYVYNEEAGFDGDGTETSPYLIRNLDDWNKFVIYINNGLYNTSHYKLMAPITVTTIAGDATHSFNGTFDGNGNTITVSYGSSNSPVSSEYAAPFAVVDGATIKNLTTTGTIYSSAKYASGLVGQANGRTMIQDCHCSVTINSTVSGDATNGGFIGVQGTGNQTTSIHRCVFDGKLLGGSANKCGGFVGWRNTYLRIYNSLYAPAAIGGSETEVNAEGSATFTRNGYTDIDGSFYTRTLGDVQGALSYPMDNEPANIGDELKALSNSFLKVYTNGLEYDGKYYVAAAINLQNNADNSELLSFCNGYLLSSVTLKDRTLYKDDKWNTLCLPFNLTISGSVLDGCDIRTLSSAGYDNETLTLNFTDAGTVTTIEAGKPYIIKWANGDNLVNPVFTNVTIRYTASPITVDDVVSFNGTYGYFKFTKEDRSILFLGEDNTLHYPLENATIGAQHAYFQLLGGLTVGESTGSGQQNIKAFNLNFGDETTGIDSIHNSEYNVAGSWYSLDGRKLEGKPTKAGIYVNNHRKVVIK